jgi:RND family efflux transporter MFP subunit
MRRARLLLVLLLASVAGTVTGCGKGGSELPPPEPPTVGVVKPRLAPLRPTKEFTGRLATKDPVKVVPQVSGRLVAREFKDGADVEEGKSVLFRIDPVMYQAEVDKAKADIAKAKADMTNWTAQILRDKDEYARQKQQIDSGAGSKLDYEKALANWKVSEAQLDVAKAAKAAGESALVKAEENLRYCTIYAPTTGRVRESLMAPGNLVDAYKTDLVWVYPITPIYAYWEVDELTSLWYRNQINAGAVNNPLNPSTPLDVAIKLKNEKEFSTNTSDRSRHSMVNFADLVIDRGTGTKTIRAEFVNKPEIGPDGKPKPIPPLSAGDSVRVRISAGAPRLVLAVPETVVFTQQRKQYVYVVADGKAQLREIEPGAAFEGLIEVNRRASAMAPTGLDENDTVIADNLLRVRPGVPVTVR